MVRLFTELFGRLRSVHDTQGEEPIREELYSVERLEQYASLLAAEHTIKVGVRRGRLLLPRLEDNRRALIATYRILAEAIRNERTISPAAEWLVDNFHIVEEQLREIREDLPKGYYHELPKLAAGELTGYPRIYAVALALIAHTDSRLDAETLRRFIRAYQQVTPLSIGELWATPISLRLALVENLRRLAANMVSARVEREAADALADEILELAARQPEEIGDLVSEQLGNREKPGHAFVVQLAGRLRDQDPAVMTALDWLERQLVRQKLSTEQVVHAEHGRQAAAQVTVGNIITSMRLLSTLDWKDFFESVSLIDPVLSSDPAGAYARMDFTTRDRYRHVIERISKRTRIPEFQVAQRALEMAAEARRDEPLDERRTHVGYYLIADGLVDLESAFAYRPRIGERAARAVLSQPTAMYLGIFSFLTSLIISLLAFYAYRSGARPLTLIWIVLLTFVPATDLALSVLNWALTFIFQPRQLPKLDTSSGLPEHARTMVVVPTMFTSEETVHELLERIEVHFLANQDEHLYYALLGDFSDAPEQEMPEDAALLDDALSSTLSIYAA